MMRTAGATRSYQHSQKNHWRRTIWNEVLRRTDGREKTQPILYLAGPEDNDRRIATGKGVPGHNLIAIDRDEDNVLAVRRQAGLAIHGDALDVLYAWPEDRPVAAVLLDFCAGVVYGTAGVYDAFERKPLRQAVGMVNFMRGRDAWSNQWRDILARNGQLLPIWLSRGDQVDPRPLLDDTNHRAYQFLLMHALQCVSVAVYGGWQEDHQGRVRMAFPDMANPRDPLRLLQSLYLSAMAPRFYSYQSGRLVFDSAVFWSHARVMELVRARHPKVAEMADAEIARCTAQWRIPRLVRRIAATLAIRTRRHNGGTTVC